MAKVLGKAMELEVSCPKLSGNDGPLADAILDRIVHDAYKINIESLNPAKDISMHEIYGLDKKLSE